MVVTYQYHVEKDQTDPDGKRNLRARSRYRMMARIENLARAEALVKDLKKPENVTKPWKWPDDDWQGEILYSKDASNLGYSRWLRMKLKKAVKWEDWLKIADGWKKDPDIKDKKRRDKVGYVKHNDSWKFETEGYTDGTEELSLKDRDKLLTKVGKTLKKEIRMKLVGENPTVNDTEQPV